MNPSSLPALPPELQLTSEPWKIVGICKVTFWRLRKAGKAPHPLDIPSRKNYWRVADILAWFKDLKPRGSHRNAS
jgi:predicted DNA-binding transcriptional regulator AlpA